MNKYTRHEKIIELVANNEIETQGDLAALLNECGFKTTQATVSRDIKELRLEKRPNGKKNIYYYPEKKLTDNNKYKLVFAQGFNKIDQAGNLVVIKTVSGMAMAVAAALDSLDLEEIVGTIAGDDTIMIATRSDHDAKNLIHHVNDLISNL